MRVLGVDCGTERTGYGVVESDGRAHRLIAAGVVKTNPKHALASRLAVIAAALRNVIREYSPECAAVEAVFHAANAQTAIKLAHVRGVALLVIAESGLEIGEYSPLEIKTSVVGYGRAEKSQVQLMICSLLHLEREQPEDASDALAAAICHATRQTYGQALGKGAGAR